MAPQMHGKRRNRPAERRPRGGSQTAGRLQRSWRTLAGVAVLALAAVAAWQVWMTRASWSGRPRDASPGTQRPELLSADPATAQDGVAALRAEAFDVARSLLERFPDNADALYVVAATNSRHANQAEAVKLWERCVQLNPRHGDAHFGIGMLAFNAGDFDTSVDHLRAALATDPRWSDARIALAKALIQQGENTQAVAVLEEQVRLDPQSVEGHFRLGQAWLQLEKYEQARDASLQAIALDPECRYAYYAAAMASRQLGQVDESRQLLERYKAQRSADKESTRDRYRNRDDEADMRASLVFVCLIAADVYAAYGEPESAVRLWRRAAALDPNDRKSRERLVEHFKKSGPSGDALDFARDLCRIDPDNPRYREAYEQLLRATTP